MFSFNLFGFDYMPEEDVIGFWFFDIMYWNTGCQRSLFAIHWESGLLIMDFLFVRFA